MCPDPEPHTWTGLSIADIVKDIQRIKSSILRNVLDSLAFSIHPRTLVVEGQCNLDDVLNQEIGSIIRARSPSSVVQLSQPFVGQQALPILGLLDSVLEKGQAFRKRVRDLMQRIYRVRLGSQSMQQ